MFHIIEKHTEGIAVSKKVNYYLLRIHGLDNLKGNEIYRRLQTKNVHQY